MTQVTNNFYLVLCPLKYNGLESLEILQVKPENHETRDNLPINTISRVASEKEENKSIYAVS